MKKLFCILICVFIFSGCVAPTDSNGTITSNITPSSSISSDTQAQNSSTTVPNSNDIDISTAKAVELEADVLDYLQTRVYGLSRAGTYYEFDGLNGLNLESLRVYLTEAATVRWYPFLEPVFVEQDKWQRGRYLSYENIMKILSDEFEITEFPFVNNKPEEIFLNISPTELTGGNSKEELSFKEIDEYIIVNCKSAQCYDWFQPKKLAEVDGEIFFKDTDLNDPNAPYIKKEINYIFKKRDGKFPMLIRGELVD